MYNYFFHKDNPKNIREVTEEFKSLLNGELYQNAMKSVKAEYLSTYQRLVLKYAIKKNIFMLKVLRSGKGALKYLQGKK